MALHLLALATVFGHWAVGRAEVFGKRHRRNKAPYRSTVRPIINHRLRGCGLWIQQGRGRRGRLDQHSRGYLDCHRIGRAGVIHPTTAVYEQSNDEPARIQVPNVQRGATYGAVVYDDHFVEHDYSADVSSEWYETIRVLGWAYAVAGQRIERHLIAAHGAFI